VEVIDGIRDYGDLDKGEPWLTAPRCPCWPTKGSNLSIVAHQMRRLVVVAVGERLNPPARPAAPPI
jgi:hypothetical protein